MILDFFWPTIHHSLDLDKKKGSTLTMFVSDKTCVTFLCLYIKCVTLF